MADPTVCAIMLTADRPEMARRAVECFRRQTYANKRLLVLITEPDESMYFPCDPEEDGVTLWQSPASRGKTIGELRNKANEGCAWHDAADILMHWDDDDWSHPNRIAEQVALLQASGAEAVGYREMLFWRQDALVWQRAAAAAVARNSALDFTSGNDSGVGEAWLYSNRKPTYCLGTSLCYWRKTWERRPFEALHDGEDTAWLLGVKPASESAIAGVNGWVAAANAGNWSNPFDDKPRMIASIHGANTGQWYKPELLRASEKQGGEWRRVPEWDDYCRGVMSGSNVMSR